MARDWRVEGDDEWLARHSSDSFGRLRRRFGRFSRLGDAISHAELGPFGGAPRSPRLKIGGKSYSVVRYVEHHIAYTAIQIDLEICRWCGHRLREVHQIVMNSEDGGQRRVGAVRVCRRCQSNSWMFYSRMPHTRRARVWARKVVL